jgi:Uma2 family endonuclease
MASTLRSSTRAEVKYPTSDGKPVAETELHLDVTFDTRDRLQLRYADDPMVYVGCNMLVYYIERNPRKHLAPDIFVVRGVPKLPKRDYWLIWKEKKAPEAAIEITSSTTAKEDQGEKLRIYREVWKVKEYVLFDPRADYLNPPLQGFRLHGSQFVRIKPVAGRLPSKVLGLHLECDGERLRLYDPIAGEYLATAREKIAQAEAAQKQAEAEVEQLRREIDALRQRSPK